MSGLTFRIHRVHPLAFRITGKLIPDSTNPPLLLCGALFSLCEFGILSGKYDELIYDSHSLISFFRKEPTYVMVRDLLVKIANNESEAFISSINVGEIYYMLVKKGNIKIADAAIASLKQFPLNFIDPDFNMCLEAAALKAKFSLSYANAFAAALTISKKATLITGDKEFDALIGEAGFKVKYL